MKSKKAALYNPYLNTLGGGEKHILSILKALEDEGFSIDIFWNEELSTQIEKRFDLKFNNLNFIPNIFKDGSSVLKKLAILGRYEKFFYVTDGSYFFSTAKKNYVFAMVPKKESFDQGFLNKLKLTNWNFITNSGFTQSFLSKWGIKSQVIYPFLDEKFLDNQSETVNKEKIILTVGRFFDHLHTKNHNLAIEVYKRNNLKLKGFKLILAGGLIQEDQDYFNKLKKLAGGDRDIIFKTNLSFHELLELYNKSLIYWHFAGFGVDEQKNPELVEHFGITPLEAMARGCLTFVYDAGGPREIVKDNQNGFIFKNEEVLMVKTLDIVKNNKLQEKIRASAQEFIEENFSYRVFQEKVRQVLDL